MEKGRYEYERYRGLEIWQGEAELRKGEKVEKGHFYLRERESGALLKLYPLTFSWLLEASLTGMEGANAEAALYKWLSGSRAIYLLPVMFVERPTEEVVDEIVKLQVLVQLAREEWAEAPKLTWELLIEGLEGITEEQVGEGEGKYDRGLYLEREEVKEAFEEFLWGEKRGFVLTGRSGVGKSNFLLALRDVYRERGGDVCMVVYNGANLKVGEDLLERLGEDLGRVLGARRLDRVLGRIGEIEGVEECRVVLAVDAVNEHPEAAAVMELINEVIKTAKTPWLKVVVTSRPEAWRTIRRELKDKLVEDHYYRRRGEHRLGVELEGFTYQEPWVKMKEFGGGELPEVYEKYRGVYRLQTRYEELTERMRQVMRDPLMMQLVARICAEKRVPADVRMGEIYGDYVDMLVKTKRLEMGDVRFLERELVPLMVGGGRYGNAVTAERVDEAKTAEEVALFDLIHNLGVGTSGRRVNQGFQNLADVEILALRGGAQAYRIEFAYERFYEYFVGKRLKELVGEDGKRQVEEYIRLVGKTEARPYLWGAVRTAILREEGKGALLREMAEEEDDRVKEMVVDCLVEMGKETVRGKGEKRAGYEETVRFVRGLMGVRAVDEGGGVLKRGLGKVVRMARRVVGARYVDELHARHLKDIGLEVVYGLADSVAERGELYEVLMDAFGEPLWETRRKATRYLYSLWRLHPAERGDILERVSARIVLANILLNNTYLQTAIDFGLRILFGHYNEPETLRQLQRASLQLLDRIPQVFVTAGAMFAPSILSQLLPMKDVREFNMIFERPDYKQTLLRLGLLLDPREEVTPEDLDVIRQALLQTDNAYNLYDKSLLPWFSKNVLGVQLRNNFHGYQPFLEGAFSEAGPVARQWLLAALSFYTPLHHDAASPEKVYAVVDRLSRTFVADRGRFLASDWYDSGAYPLIHVSRLYCDRYTTAIPFFCDLLEQVQAEEDWELARRLIVELANAGYVYPVQALESLSVLENWEHEEIRQTMSDVLAIMRFRYPDLCDRYLEQKGVSQAFWDHVRRNRGDPDLAKLIDNQEANQFGRDALLNWPELSQWIVGLWEQAEGAQNFQEFLRLAINRAVGLVRDGTGVDVS